MDYTKLLTGRSGDGARSTTKELSDRCSTQIKAHRRYPLDLPSKNEVQIKEALRRICDGDTYRAVASSHFQSMVQTYALEAYKINKTGDLQIRWTQVQEFLLQHPWGSPNDSYPKTSTWWNVKKGEKGVKTNSKTDKISGYLPNDAGFNLFEGIQQHRLIHGQTHKCPSQESH